MVSASLTDIGKVREVNEDSVIEAGNLFAVADGMGGHQAGEVASSLALSVIEQYVEDNLGVLSGEQLVEKALAAANTSVYRKASSSARFRSMGTTATLLYREGGTAYIGNIGDSRAYLYRGGELKRLTSDHSLVARLVAEGQITEEESRRHPQRNIILRALGLERQVEADVVSVEIQTGDRFLLATDGLTGQVDDGEIERAAAAASDPRRLARALVDMALATGGPDNVSVVIVSFEESSSVVPVATGPGAGPPGSRDTGDTSAGAPAGVTRKRRLRRGLLLALALVVIAGACLGVGYYFYNRSFFVGSRDGRVALFKGFPFWGLATVEKSTDMDVTLLTDASRRKVSGNMEIESHEEALKTLEALEKEAADCVLVPDVVGKKYEEASKLLEDAGLVLIQPPVLVSSENAKAGTVFRQDPDPYTRVGRGTGVRLWVVGGKTTRGV